MQQQQQNGFIFPTLTSAVNPIVSGCEQQLHQFLSSSPSDNEAFSSFLGQRTQQIKYSLPIHQPHFSMGNTEGSDNSDISSRKISGDEQPLDLSGES
jgi:hypothetical protein